MEEIKLDIEMRAETGKQSAKHYRNTSKIPAILYGHKEKNVNVLVDEQSLETIFRYHGQNVMVSLKIEGEKKSENAIIRDVQINPLTQRIIHIDLQRISMKENIHIQVSVHLIGSPIGVRTEGGILDLIIHSIDIECTPKDIPDFIEVDITELKIGDSIHVRDISFDKGKILTDEKRTIVTILPPKVVIEPTVEALEEVFEEEGERAEPEVIGQKKEEEKKEE